MIRLEKKTKKNSFEVLVDVRMPDDCKLILDDIGRTWRGRKKFLDEGVIHPYVDYSDRYLWHVVDPSHQLNDYTKGYLRCLMNILRNCKLTVVCDGKKTVSGVNLIRFTDALNRDDGSFYRIWEPDVFFTAETKNSLGLKIDTVNMKKSGGKKWQ